MKPWIAWLLVRNNGAVVSGRYLREPAWTPSGQFEQNLLDPKQRASEKPGALGSVIAYNESYMDIVDWAYQKVGPLEIAWVASMAMPMGLIVPIYLDTFLGRNPNPFYSDSVITIIFLPFILWFSRILFNTFTGCTHYPVRLDRKNQMVHVFRHNGEGGVSSYPWRDITFGMIGGGALQRSFARNVMAGYVRRPDGSYDYFRLGVMWITEEGMRGQWEYYRRYMEEGLHMLPTPEFLLPIQNKRESFRIGAQLCWFWTGPMLGPAVFLSPLTVPGSLLRWVIMRTRRLPRWPQHIVDLCTVSPDDRYASRPPDSLNVSLWLAFVVTVGVLAVDAALLYKLIAYLHQPGYH